MNAPSLIGLSVSFCIHDIATGKISIDDVLFISAGTKCRTADDWESVIKTYRDIYWYQCADIAESIARELIANGKIIQPRLEDQEPVRANACSNWINRDEYNALARAQHSNQNN